MQRLSCYIRIFLACCSLGIGLTLLLLKFWILELIASKVLFLGPDSVIQNIWLRPPELLTTDIYFFNWTNPEDFRNLSTKPKLQEVGPYRYMHRSEKRNVVYNDNNTITFNEVRYFDYVEEYPSRNVSERITVLNVFGTFLAHLIRYENYFIKRAASAFIAFVDYNYYFTKTIDECLGGGIEDLTLVAGRYFPYVYTHVPRFENFGVLKVRNGSDWYEGVFNMGNGVNGDFDVKSWSYYTTTPNYNGTCAKVGGSAGEIYTRTETRDYIEVFAPDLCRTVKLDFEEEVVVDGITGLKYSIGNSALDNGTLIPENKCNCAGNCIPSGVVNASSCRYGVPLFGSLPHFYKADPVYLDAVEGLQPKKSKHETYIVLEPKTKLILEAVVRAQMVILVQPIEYISLYEDIPTLYFPILWGELRGNLPRYLLVYLKIYLLGPNIIIGISVILISLGLCMLAFVTCRSRFSTLYEKLNVRNVNEPLTSEEVPLKEETQRTNLDL